MVGFGSFIGDWLSKCRTGFALEALGACVELASLDMADQAARAWEAMLSEGEVLFEEEAVTVNPVGVGFPAAKREVF